MKTNWMNNDGVLTATLENGSELRIEPNGVRFNCFANGTLVATRNTEKRAKNSTRFYGSHPSQIHQVNPMQRGRRPKVLTIQIPGLVAGLLDWSEIGVTEYNEVKIGSGT